MHNLEYFNILSSIQILFSNILVVDHYKLDIVFENFCSSYVEKILVIDDLANRKHKCDFLLDQTLNRDKNDYIKLVPKKCKLLVGSDYIILKKQFLKENFQTLPTLLYKLISTYRFEEATFVAGFILIFSLLIYLLLDNKLYNTIPDK